MSLITTACPCIDPVNQQFCGHAIIEHKMCLLPPIFNVTGKTFISVEIVPNSTIVELVTCELIVVCGLLRKIVTGPDINNNQQTFTEDIPFQAQISDENITDLTISKYHVASVGVSNACYKFTCKTADGSFFKLLEKDIIDVRVTYTAPA